MKARQTALKYGNIFDAVFPEGANCRTYGKGSLVACHTSYSPSLPLSLRLFYTTLLVTSDMLRLALRFPRLFDTHCSRYELAGTS
ncbi:hypothetical protein Pmani_022245 [Petrolisthes manimaculis]|uniref:Uncharacterized protein n=1 Tax=Petrolisthes manimaculis TaxID=1843537 RepID=A0AAE1PCH7_9EUCA|nr:hypothetical protein Pmani_022245 [Petrolisthes manimaculis]